MKIKKDISKLIFLFLVTFIFSRPIDSYASEQINYRHYVFDSDELRLSNLQGELLLDYFEPVKENLKAETILYTPTSMPQNIRYIYTLSYDYDALGNILFFDFKEYEKGTTLIRGKSYFYNYSDKQQLTSYTLTELGLRWGNPTSTNSYYLFQYNNQLQLTSANFTYNTHKGSSFYTYNELNQLTNITYTNAGYSYQKEYYYDALGNCIEYRCGSFQNFYTYNEAKQITTLRAISYLENGSTLSDYTYYFTYDAYGNICAVTVDSLTMGKHTNTHSLTIQNQYDSFNRLLTRNVINSKSGITTTYVYEYMHE